MARFRTLQSSFVAGEFDPSLLGRRDIEEYAKGLSRARNVYIRPQGGAFRREGLAYFSGVNGNNKARLIPFQFNDAQTYLLCFTQGRMDVYRTDIYGTIQATITTSPISAMTDLIISEMNWTQSADTLLIFHKDIQPIKITRTSHTAWTASNVVFKNIPVYAFGAVSTSNPAGTIQPDVTTGLVTVTGVGTNFTSSAYEGQYINTPKGGRIFVKKVNSTTSLEGVITIELAATSVISSGSWELETGYEPVISPTRGWVSSGVFHKSRLALGGLKERPQTLIFSKIGDFFNLDVGEGLDDEAINITIDDDQVNAIRNLFSGRGLNIFTSGGEFSIRSDINSPITPSNIVGQLQKETRHGSAQVRPVSVDGAVMFIERESPTDSASGRIIRQFVYNDVEQSFTAKNISIFSQHLIIDPVSMDIRRSTTAHPSNYLYVVNSDGTCAVLNSLREQNLLAWSLFTTSGTFEDVSVSGNNTYFIVKRTINGSTVRYIEVLNPDNFMDSSILQTSGTPSSSWSNLSSLEGETVKIRGDDFILDDEVVVSGSITSSKDVLSLEAGINFSAEIESLPVDVIIQGESNLGEYKSIVFANILLKDSRNILVSSSRSYAPAFRKFGTGTLDAPISLFTGYKKVYIGGTGRELTVTVTQDEPLEFNVLAIHYGIRI